MNPLRLVALHRDAYKTLAETDKGDPMEAFNEAQAARLTAAHDQISALIDVSRAVVACPVLGMTNLARQLRAALEPFN